MCKVCKTECIGKTPCTDCRRKVKYVWLIPVAASLLFYWIGVVV